jgi:hypothetical protein
MLLFVFVALRPNGGLWPPRSRGLLITHDAPQSAGLLWTSDQLVAETPTWQHTTLTTNIHAPGVIQTHDRSMRAAVDLRLRQRGHWDRQHERIMIQNYAYMCVCVCQRMTETKGYGSDRNVISKNSWTINKHGHSLHEKHKADNTYTWIIMLLHKRKLINTVQVECGWPKEHWRRIVRKIFIDVSEEPNDWSESIYLDNAATTSIRFPRGSGICLVLTSSATALGQLSLIFQWLLEALHTPAVKELKGVADHSPRLVFICKMHRAGIAQSV